MAVYGGLDTGYTGVIEGIFLVNCEKMKCCMQLANNVLARKINISDSHVKSAAHAAIESFHSTTESSNRSW